MLPGMYRPTTGSTFDLGPKPEVRRMTRSYALQRILGAAGLTIHDVVNSPVAKNRAFGYYRLSKLIDRRAEVLELEKQWNPLGLSERR